jgi:Fe-Mn family superoxide dismutase
MAMLAQGPYKQHDFPLTGLTGISDKQIEVHKGLYAGYVRNVNILNERIAALEKDGKIGTPDWAELTRRLGFEYDGMILHEYYFGNLRAGASPLDPSSALGRALQQAFGSVDAWLADFKGIGAMRGVGWAVLFQDPATGWLSNHWLTLHQDGVPAGFKPILVLDVWEHAFMVDYVPAERPKYIDAFFQNVDWDAVQQRLASPAATRPIG